MGRRIPIDWNKRDLCARRDFWNFGKNTYDAGLLVPRDRVCAAEVWCECFNGDLKAMKKSDSYELNGILSTIDGWERSKGPAPYGPYYGKQRGFVWAGHGRDK